MKRNVNCPTEILANYKCKGSKWKNNIFSAVIGAYIVAWAVNFTQVARELETAVGKSYTTELGYLEVYFLLCSEFLT